MEMTPEDREKTKTAIEALVGTAEPRRLRHSQRQAWRHRSSETVPRDSSGGYPLGERSDTKVFHAVVQK